jgi:hypothetical protein
MITGESQRRSNRINLKADIKSGAGSNRELFVILTT